jgi:hypothetical protein
LNRPAGDRTGRIRSTRLLTKRLTRLSGGGQWSLIGLVHPGRPGIMNKLRTVLPLVVLLGVVLALVHQHQLLARLRDENEQLRSQVRALAQTGGSTERPAGQEKGATVLQRPGPDSSSELLKLRGEVALLRRQNAELLQEMAQLRPLGAEEQRQQISSLAADAMVQVTAAARAFLAANNDRFPTNLAQCQDFLPARFAGSLGLEAFELVPNAPRDDTRPFLLLLRERVPRKAADGTWGRIYSYADGSVGEVISVDGNYDDWEKAQTGDAPSSKYLRQWRAAPGVEPGEQADR